MMEFRTYRTLPEEAAFIRRTVFVEEQGFVQEFDRLDDCAVHIVLFAEEKVPAATCRYFWDEEQGCYVIGRIAVLKAFRRKHCGAALLCEAERQLREKGAEKAMLAAQVQAKGFYEKLGYRPIGDVFWEEHCPHVWMCKMWEDPVVSGC